MNTEMTFEEINAHLEKNANEGLIIPERGANPADILQKICAIYRGVKPLIMIVFRLPIPAIWKDRLKQFVDMMDSICL